MKTKTKTKSTKSPSFARITPENEAWVAKQVVATGHSLTTITNRAIECARLGTKFKLEPYEPMYVKKLKAAHENRLARFKTMAEKAGEASA